MTGECSAHAEYGKNYEVLLLAFGQMPNWVVLMLGLIPHFTEQNSGQILMV